MMRRVVAALKRRGFSLVWKRVEGRSYPVGVYPEGLRLLDLGRLSWMKYHLREGDVLVLRGGNLTASQIREVAVSVAPVPVVVLPGEVRVHVEERALRGEDLGYRETATYGRDKVFHGVGQK